MAAKGAHSPTLEPPPTSLGDPGAHELDSSDDHFSDAAEGPGRSEQASPVPTTRVEKVDDAPSHGEVPGTDAYQIRTQDAVPDEVEIQSGGRRSSSARRPSAGSSSGTPEIPATVVDKVDPLEPSHGEVPGTLAREMREADAMPDAVRQASSTVTQPSRSRADSTPGDLPIPVTKVVKVDSGLRHGEIPGTEAFDMRTEDANPDVIEHKADPEGLPTPHDDRSRVPLDGQTSDGKVEEESDETGDDEKELGGDDGGDDGEFGEDFDDFEQGEEADEFGDFDDGFQKAEDLQRTREAAREVPEPSATSKPPLFPILDFDTLQTYDDVYDATSTRIDQLFPIDDDELLTRPDPILAEHSIFLSERSLSLWSQLVATPPLQPSNWVRSRIRRLFLVSLGVPVDLDEILPASKQKKLVLPSIQVASDGDEHFTPTVSDASRPADKSNPANNNSTASVNSQTHDKQRKRRGPPPPPELDLGRAAMLCNTTNATLTNFTLDELKSHVDNLSKMNSRASEVLEYWLKRKDGAIGDKEAFEGVIENLVKHARKVRK